MNNSKYPVLYSFRRCPYAMRSRMALSIANISCELREVVLRDKPAEMLAISNKGTVPVLQLSDGQVIEESLGIMYWALRQHDPEKWLDGDESETRLLIEQNDVDFKDKLDRYKYHERYPEHSQQYYRQQTLAFLNHLEARLDANAGVALLDTRVTLADIAIFPFIRQFSGVDSDWFANTSYTKLKRWLSSLENSDLFQSVMKKHAPWTPDTPANIQYASSNKQELGTRDTDRTRDTDKLIS